MTDSTKKLVLSLLKNGLIKTSDVTNAGIHRSALTELVNSGDLVQCSRGIYMPSEEWEDDFFLYQQKYKRGIYSHSTALYLLGYSERVPLKFHMTFPTNYNSSALNNDSLLVTRVGLENYESGIINVDTPFGNPVKVYNLERSLCDVLRGSDNDIQTINFAMKKYANSKDKNLSRLMKYASALHVEPKVKNYMEVLL